MKTLPDQIPELEELHLWKILRSTKSACNGVSILEYRCPMLHLTYCTAGLLIVSGNGFKQLESCCSHDLDSHIRQAAMSVHKIDEEDEDSDHPYLESETNDKNEECNEEAAKDMPDEGRL